jgi:glycosyltransferase involved in cell wall biosynthesis
MLTQSLPKISIIIGVLNMEKYLARTLESVILQQYPNLELIIIDGGSTDGTIEIIKKYQQVITYWKSEKDKGHCDACNKGIPIATGDLIEFLNADDFLDAGMLHKVAEVYVAKPHTKIITCGVRIIENNLNDSSKQLNDAKKLQISLHNMIFELPAINARFFHKDIFKQFGQFNPTLTDGSYNITNDREFLIKLALANVKSEIIPNVFYNYLSHDQSLTFSVKNQLRIRHEHINLAHHFLNTSQLHSTQQTIFKTWIAKETTYLFLAYLLRCEFKKALSSMVQGIKTSNYRWFWKVISVLITSSFRKTAKFISS